LAAALLVLLSTGVAISRMSDGEEDGPVATGPSSTSSTLPGLGQPGPATSGGPATGADSGGVAEQAAAASGGVGSGESAVVHGVGRSDRKASGEASTSDSSAAAAGPSAGSGSGSAAGGAASGGEAAPPSGGGQEPPPSPSQVPPEDTPLAAAHVSAGEGAQGAVVGADLGDGQPAELDVTIGTNQLVGDHPPAEGTGVDLGGRLLGSASSPPVLT
jgi:hypothetical protein